MIPVTYWTQLAFAFQFNCHSWDLHRWTLNTGKPGYLTHTFKYRWCLTDICQLFTLWYPIIGLVKSWVHVIRTFDFFASSSLWLPFSQLVVLWRWQQAVSKITFAESMLHQSNLFQNIIRLQHYQWIKDVSVSSVFQTWTLFKGKLAFLLLIITLTVQLNADDKSGIKKSGSISQNYQAD